MTPVIQILNNFEDVIDDALFDDAHPLDYVEMLRIGDEVITNEAMSMRARTLSELQ